MRSHALSFCACDLAPARDVRLAQLRLSSSSASGGAIGRPGRERLEHGERAT
jgi:hypothetical protein